MKNHLLFVVLAGVVAACGSTETVVAQPAPAPTDPAPVTPPVTTPTKPVVDHGAPSTKYPAFTPAMGQLANNGGATLPHPVIVTVTWADDEKADDIEALGDTIGASPYWAATNAEYGSGAAVSGPENHVRLPDAAPTSMSDTQLATFVSTNVANGTFPTPATGEPIYVLHLQKATKLLLNGQNACAQGVGGYHDSTKVGLKSVAYAIVPRCGSSFDSVTVALSHELSEAASNPYPRVHPPGPASVRTTSPGSSSSSSRARTVTRASFIVTPIFAPAPRAASRTPCSASGRTSPQPPVTTRACPPSRTPSSSTRRRSTSRTSRST